MTPRRRSLLRLARTLLQGAGLLVLGSSGCGGDGNTGVGGVLVVAQVQVDAGNRIVLVGGTRQLAASPRTSTGIVVPGKTISWSSGNPSVATVDGSGLVRGLTAGVAQVTATVDGVTGRVDIDVRPVPVASVEVTLGATSLLAGLTTTAQVVARDSVAGILTGRVPSWSSSNTDVATVSIDGVVTAVASGSANIIATIEGKTGSAPLEVTARSASRLGFISQPGPAVAGAPIAPPVRVAFQDATGGTANEMQGSITLGFSANPTGAILGGTLTVPAVNGVATFSDLRVDRAGQPYSLQATATGFPVATSGTFAVSAGGATALGVATAPAGSASSGAPLVVQPVIEVRDALGNRVAQAGVQVTASVATGPGVLAGTLTVPTGADGRAAFTDLAIVGAVGSYTLRFVATGLADAISSPIGLGAGGATQLTFTVGPPASQPNAEPVAPAVRVQLRDGTGNPVAQAGTTVAAVLQGGSALLSGVVSAVTGASGEAVFAGLVITGVAGNYTLSFTAAGVTPAVSNPIALVAGVERSVGFVTPPGPSSTNGAPLPVTPVLQLRDISGNAVAKPGVSITAQLQSVVTGVLSGTLARTTDAQGRASFPGLVITGQVGEYTLSFRSGALAEALSNPIQLQAGAGVALGFRVSPPLGAQNGVPFVPQPVVQVVDQSGNQVAQGGVQVSVALASGPGLLGGTSTATTDGTGAASFAGLALTGATGGYTLRFTAAGLTSLVSSTITVGAGAPTQVTFTTAPPATAQNATALAPAVVVQLRDAAGNPVAQPGVTITASLASGAGLLGGTTTEVTGAGGSASFAGLVITGTVGAFTLQFSAPGLTAAVSNAIALGPGPATQLTFTVAPPATAVNGAVITPSVVVQARDVSGNPVPQAGLSIGAAIHPGSGAVLGGTTTVATAGTGAATFGNLTLLGLIGDYTLRFSTAGVTPATSNTLTLQPGPATALAITTQPPPSSTSGATLSPQPVVRLVDQSGNLVPTGGVTVTAALASGPGTLGGTLTAATVNGVASFATLALTGPTGSYTIGFTAPGVTGVTSGTIGLGAGAATALAFVGSAPTSAQRGVVITPAIQVRLVDASANPVSQAGVVVTAVKVSSPGNLTGTLTAATDAAGIASFSNLTLSGPVGNYTLRFDVSGITSVQAVLTLSAGPASQLLLTTAPPATATNGAALSPQPIVQVADGSGNPVSQSGLLITAAITAGTGALTSATATTNASGVATFSGLTITGTAGAFTLSFSGGALTPATAAVSLQPGPATRLALFTAPGAVGTSGQLLAPQPVIQLEDQSGNAVSTAGVNIAVAFGSTPGPAALGGTTTAATAANGRASFSDLSISGTAGDYTLAFSSAGLTGVTSGVIAVGAGAGTQLTFTAAPPASGTNGADLTPATVVQVRDGSGNPVAQGGISIAAAIVLDAGGTLGGTTPVLTDGTGAATFPDLRITGTAGDYTIRFSAAGLTSALSNTISIAAGPPTLLAFVTAPPLTAANGATIAPAPAVQLRDQSNNPVATTGTSITADLAAGAGGTLGGTLSRPTAAGVATFDDLAITGATGNYTLRFSAAGLTPVSAPAPLALTAGPATQLGLAVAPSGSATSGVALATQPQVQVRDQSGNPVAQGGLLVTAVASAGATLANATATTDVTGLATFSGLTLTGAAGAYTLTFTATGFPDLAGGSVTVGAGAATQMVFITAPPAGATNGQVLSPQPVVELRDASNNPVLVAGTGVTASIFSGPGGVLAGTTTVVTAADGRASFTDLAVQGLPGTYVIRFSSGALPTLDSGDLSLAIGPATKLVFQASPPAGATNGQVLAPSTVVALADLTGNVVPTDGVSITAAVASGPGATLGGTTSRLTASGLATFDDLTLTGTAGSYTLDFSSGALTKATSGPLALGPGAATQLFFATAPPAAGASGAALSPAVVVQLRDASNNNVPDAGVTVTAAIFSGGGGGASLAGASAMTDASGRATFSTLAIAGPADSYSLAFTSGALTGLVSSPIAITAGAAVKLGFATTPSASVQNGKPLAQQPVVRLLDAANNPVAQAGVDVTVSINSGGGALSGTSLTVGTDAAGQAAFAGLTITGTIGIRTLAFAGTGLTTLASGDIDVTAGDAVALEMVVEPPATATSGVPLGSDPSVRLVDASGNAVVTAGTSVDVALAVAGGATLGGTTTRTTDAGGVAAFPGLAITGPGGNYQLAFSSTGLTGVTSTAIALTAATGLSITVSPPATARNDLAFSQQPAVQLVDGSNAPVALAGVTITASIASGGGVTVGTATAITNGSGLATFLDLGIRGTIGDRTLEFAAAGLTPDTSGTVALTAGVATALAVVVDAPASAVDEQVLGATPSVRLVDVSANPVDSTGVDVAVAVSPAGPVVGGTTTQATVAGGTASFPGLSLNGAAGSYTLDFSASGLTGVSTSALTLAVPVTLTVTIPPPANAVDNTVFATQPQVRVDDAGPAPLTGVLVTVDLIVDSGAGVLAGTLTATTGAGGLADWTDLKIQGTGAFRLRFRAANGAEVISAVVSIP